jgi:hypothetical protein
MSETRRKAIGVVPSGATEEHGRLFGALEDAFPVTFEGRDPQHLHGLSGLLVLAAAPAPETGAAPSPETGAALWPETLSPLLEAGLPTLVAFTAPAAGRTAPSTAAAIELSRSQLLAGPLRGRALLEGDPPACELADAVPEAGRMLARVDGRPVWWHADRGGVPIWFSAYAPEELAEGETLREGLRSGRFMGMTALLHLIWHACEQDGTEHGLRACFVVDDPNLHACSYGYLHYRELAAHATAHGYHIAFAMVPLDGWWTSGRAASLFQDSSSALSLLMHGNDHVSRELGCEQEAKMEHALAQALKRVATFERRAGVAVARVMAPPHEICSQAALAAMFRLGFDGACIGRPYPWKDRPHTWTFSPLIKWRSADMVGGGFPIFPRHPIEHSWDELVFAALLGQPLTLFAHHWDFSGGLDVLARAADHINSLGSVQWGSMASIATQSFRTRRDGETLVVELCSRRVRIEAPADVAALRVRAPSLFDRFEPSIEYRGRRARMTPTAGGWVSEPLPVGRDAVELRLLPEQPLDPATMSGLALKPWPVLRRALVEGRDRLRPLLD